MKKIFITAVLLFTFSAMLHAQEWTKEQQEVWKVVQDYWALYAKGDIKGFLDYFHKDYCGWSNDAAVPSGKEVSQKWLEYMYQGSKVPLYQIDPVCIKVFGNTAFVHYYYDMIRESSDGKKSHSTGRWTDILLKEGGKWLVIGDHGGADPIK